MRYFCIILLFICVNYTFAQNIRESQTIKVTPAMSANIRPDLGGKKKKNTYSVANSDKSQNDRSRSTLKTSIINDTVFAIQTAKQHGWFIPNGIITKEQVSHRYSSVMFTGKNKQGHWTKVETINAYGGHSKGQFLPYILRNGGVDNSANSEWVKKLENNCIIELIADPQGINVIQERVYDDHQNLLFVYSRTPIGLDEHGKREYIGTYKDMYGLPAEMRKSEGYTYGTIVKIIEDTWGNDSIMEYLDAKGVNKLNADSVYRSVHIHDKNGQELRFGSQNEKNEYVLDSWGNCGVIQTWNEDHTMASAMYTDNKWNPMIMPSEKSREKCGVVQVIYKYDNYKRVIEEKFVDEVGNPMANIYGTHTINYKYDDKGNQIECYGLDLVGNLSTISDNEIAKYTNVFDENGRELSLSLWDKQMQLVESDNFISKRETRYDSEGKMTQTTEYSAKNGIPLISYQYQEDNRVKKWTYKDWYQIDSLDIKGRTTSEWFYTSDHKLFNCDDGWAYKKRTYKDIGHTTISTEEFFDSGLNPISCSGFTKIVCIDDSINQTSQYYKYNFDKLTECYKRLSNLTSVLPYGQSDTNGFGVTCRSGGASGVRHYNAEVLWAPYPDRVTGINISSLIAKDEFNEPDYLVSDDGTIYYYQKNQKRGNIRFDANNNEIEDGSKFKDSLPKIMSIEVTDSSAYKIGLRDNDLIICYGKYSVNLDEIITCSDFRRDWAVRSVLDATDSKRMVVFRIADASNNEYGLYEIKNLSGTCSELGFIPHMRFLTEKQKNRITEVIKKEESKSNPLISSSDIKGKNYVEGDNMILMTCTDLYRNIRNEPYGSTVKDAAILLGTCVKDRHLKWSVDKENSTSSFEEILGTRWYKAAKYPTWQFYFTTNNKDIIPLSIECQNVSPINYNSEAYTKWFDVFLSDEDFAKIVPLINIAKDNIKKNLEEIHNIPRKSLLGIWASKKESADDYSPELYMEVYKDGALKGTFVNYGTIKYNDALAIFKKEKIIDGQWTTGGNWLFYTPESNDSIRISCVDAIGLDEESKRRAIAYVNIDCRNNPQNYTSRLTLLSDDTHGDLYVYKYSKNELEFIDTNGDTIKVYKEKKLPNILLRKYDESVSNSNNSQINETSPLIGNWQCQIPDVENSYVEFDLEQDGVISIEASVILPQEVNDTCVANILIDLNVEGTWQPTSNGFKMDINPERLSINLDYNLIGVDKETEEQLIPALKEYIEPQKTEFGLALLEGFGNEMEVTEVDSVRMVMNGNILNRIPSSKTTVVGRVEGDEGYMVEKGYTGLYVILEWCDWNCKQTVDDFAAEFEKQRENEKHIVLLPVESVEGKDVFKDIIELNSITTKLGLRIMDQSVGYNYYKKNVLSKYKNFKMNKLN